jgi:cell division protein FtsB
MSQRNLNTLRRSGLHLVMIVLLILTVSLVLNFVHQVMQSVALERQRVELQTQVALLETRTTALQGAVEYAESDSYVERVAREQLSYAREGDVVVLPHVVEPTPTVASTRSQAAVEVAPSEPNWRQWWHALFGPAEGAGQ